MTGLVDDRPPVTGKRINWAPPASASAAAQLPSSSSATAGASAVSPSAAGARRGQRPQAAARAPVRRPAPRRRLLRRTAAGASASASGPQLVDVMSEPHADAVAVQNGRILKLGHSRKLGSYVVLRDVYGDVFTYAGLGSIARTYKPPASDSATSASAQAGSSASTQSASAAGGAGAGESSASGSGKVRVFAHLHDNPDARAAIAHAKLIGRATSADGRLQLRSGSIVTEGTVLGRVAVPPGAKDGHLRFAIRPAGDSGTIDPRAILANWTQLDAALHPQGAKGNPNLLGATASDVFLLSKSALERAVLSDSGIGLSSCSRHEVASGAVDERALAVIVFLSRSGLKPTVGTLPCGAYDASGYVLRRPCRRRRRDRRDQRRPDRGPSGRGVDHRHDDPHAADAAGRVRARAHRQPDALPRRSDHARASRPRRLH